MKRFWLILGTITLFSALIGCSSPNFAPPAVGIADTNTETDVEIAPTAVATNIPTQVPTAEPIPTETSEPEPTAEPTTPPTAEPAPTEIVESEPTAVPVTMMLPGSELFTFVEGEPAWYTVDDDVMGGVSSSTVDVLEPGVLYFSGTMSLDNNGGFSSVRSNWTPTDLTGKDGILLRVMGDGQVYRLRIRTESAGAGISYNALFETQDQTWTIVYVPFADMVPTYRGFVMDVGALDTASVGSFGFMLSDKQPGDFELLVDWVRAVSEEELLAVNS